METVTAYNKQICWPHAQTSRRQALSATVPGHDWFLAHPRCPRQTYVFIHKPTISPSKHINNPWSSSHEKKKKKDGNYFCFFLFFFLLSREKGGLPTAWQKKHKKTERLPWLLLCWMHFEEMRWKKFCPFCLKPKRLPPLPSKRRKSDSFVVKIYLKVVSQTRFMTAKCHGEVSLIL